MRIIAGRFRGRRLAQVGKGDVRAHLRPTPDRTRESLFNILESGYRFHLCDADVLDVCAGTGALGLEALSRGASYATFIEQGRPALRLLRENIAICGVAGRTRILPRDARRPGRAVRPGSLVFLDPPYGKGLGERVLSALLEGGWLADGALVVWEESAAVTPPASLAFLEGRRYGDTVIRLFEHRRLRSGLHQIGQIAG